MLSKKRVNKIAEQAVSESFKEGKLLEKQADIFVKQFSKLPKAEAIPFLNAYYKGVRRELDKQTLVIESATPLSPTKVKTIEMILKKSHQISKIETLTNPGLLGGIKIKIADEVYEGSLLRQIEELGRLIAYG